MECLRSVVNSLLLALAVYIVVVAQKTEPPDLDLYEKPTKDICQFLINTDQELVAKYSEKPKGQGESIMTLIREYNDNLALLVRRMAKEKRMNETLVTKAEAQPLIDHGGPEFINFYIERQVLEQDFGLNNVSSRIICAQRQNAIDMWQDFYQLTSKIPDDSDEDY